MTSFDQLGLSEDLLRAVREAGFTEPTPVQQQAIPVALQGRDIVATAKTGTGKTAAFLLPSLQQIKRGGKNDNPAPKVLILSPTRELAQQIADACKLFTVVTRHRMLCVVGGTPYGPQISKLKRGVDVLIATPGRLNDLMKKDKIDLSAIEVLVLDEADRMLDMGFWPTMEQIVAATPEARQTLLFSATIDRKIMGAISPILHHPEFIEIAQKGETAENIDQYVIAVKHQDKPEALVSLLQENGSDRTIVFMRTKRDADTCTRELRDAGFKAESIHSDKSQRERSRALENFTKNKTHILVATDVLARGIDVSDVQRVINYDLPDSAEDYVHRIGRTGRAGESGFAVSFISPAARRTLGEVERLINCTIPDFELETFDTAPLQRKGKPSSKGSRGGKGKSSGGNFRNSGKKQGYGKRSDDKQHGHKHHSEGGHKHHEDDRRPKQHGEHKCHEDDRRPKKHNEHKRYEDDRRPKQHGGHKHSKPSAHKSAAPSRKRDTASFGMQKNKKKRIAG